MRNLDPCKGLFAHDRASKNKSRHTLQINVNNSDVGNEQPKLQLSSTKRKKQPM